MSSGQKPRWPAFFPRMKDRSKGRRRKTGKPRIVLYDERFQPVWPPLIVDDGTEFRMDRGEVTMRTVVAAAGRYSVVAVEPRTGVVWTGRTRMVEKANG